MVRVRRCLRDEPEADVYRWVLVFLPIGKINIGSNVLVSR